MKIGLIQSRGIGDILIALPIAKYFRDQKHTVYWPIDERFAPSFLPAVDYVNFLPFPFEATLDGFVNRPRKLLEEAGCEKIISLYSYLTGDGSGGALYDKRLSASLKFDEYKYAIAGVPFLEKWRLNIRRNRKRETELQAKLVRQPDYVVIQKVGSNFKTDFRFPPGFEKSQKIEITEQTDNIFDWLTILENARLLVLVDSCFANLVEQLNLRTPKVFLLRSEARFTPVLKNHWHFPVEVPAEALAAT